MASIYPLFPLSFPLNQPPKRVMTISLNNKHTERAVKKPRCWGVCVSAKSDGFSFDWDTPPLIDQYFACPGSGGCALGVFPRPAPPRASVYVAIQVVRNVRVHFKVASAHFGRLKHGRFLPLWVVSRWLTFETSQKATPFLPVLRHTQAAWAVVEDLAKSFWVL